ncbi:mimitin, mitochondrial isoform X2 [Lates japonicus]|uniref:Mimitin, mitochondrial isoform X2 n=1 Tax=Lates japonicus TaxID=270547 RepID=A0AAD3NL70_LATJO|nr:mimitin, mitochondrial isoform X2 [Lates japonicus]
MSRIAGFLRRTFGIVREHVGTDHLGNKYYVIPQQKTWTGPGSASHCMGAVSCCRMKLGILRMGSCVWQWACSWPAFPPFVGKRGTLTCVDSNAYFHGKKSPVERTRVDGCLFCHKSSQGVMKEGLSYREDTNWAEHWKETSRLNPGQWAAALDDFLFQPAGLKTHALPRAIEDGSWSFCCLLRGRQFIPERVLMEFGGVFRVQGSLTHPSCISQRRIGDNPAVDWLDLAATAASPSLPVLLPPLQVSQAPQMESSDNYASHFSEDGSNGRDIRLPAGL